MIRISKGLDLPIEGAPRQEIEDGPAVARVALIGPDYVGMKPTMLVDVDEDVRLGQPLFEDKKNPGVVFTSPGCGRVVEINRGAKRAFQSIVIELDGDEEEEFVSYENQDLTTLTRDQVRENLLATGLWTALRTRPYSRVPAVDAVPHSIFITALDTNPLAARPEMIIDENSTHFGYGLHVLRHLTDGPLHVAKAPGQQIPGGESEFVVETEFAGPHPAGLPGTHIHFLDPVSEKKSVWYVNYQDVIAIGRLFTSGRLWTERIVSLAGPSVLEPSVVRTRLGAAIDGLVHDRLEPGRHRAISGSVLSGRTAEGRFEYLGRFHNQVSVVPEQIEREFLGWQRPGFDKFSIKRIFASAFTGRDRKYRFTTATNGSPRAMVPIGMFEKVMPLDIIPTYLLRALLVGDSEQAAALGCLELDEEDLALCTFVCPGKTEYGPVLRNVLTRIQAEG